MASQYDPTVVSDYNNFPEVHLFWKKRLTGASVMFLLVRYTTLAFAVVYLIISICTTMSDEGCTKIFRTWYAFRNILNIPCAVFAGMRALALTRNRALSAIILVFSLAPPIVNFRVRQTQQGLGAGATAEPIFGCSAYFNTTLTGAVICTVVSRAGAIIGDFLLVAITWRKLARGSIRTELAKHQGSLASIMMWNGVLYFSITLSSTVVLQLIGNPNGGISYVTDFTDPMTAILIWRFLFDLQQASLQDVNLDSSGDLGSHTTASYVTSLNFAQAMGMGAMGSVVVPDGFSVAETNHDLLVTELHEQEECVEHEGGA
ncbi:hypothetical protein L226DRAFT_525106 [Lentinus tigrinus ALCF2SS1-7]|uniref:uncharacterized protein n=1 Tax=Lentinus tigrinus ALCF2SS1-7 TaxID=1328758 RepID=UPI001165E4D8|nr:hypothetical protein L226DRAFT_525106 [Lentinus tigrinus ALCF2SS1-7]